ncbi:terminase family protein [Candidatus Bathyarchaeota archaeon]|nr:terminase family protein [Candidatus Bathyarchaeota archaeon]
MDISERKLSEIWLEAEKEREKLSENPITFFEQVVGFKPTSYQVDLAKKFTENQFVCMRWCRQSGKSWIAAALLLNYALMRPASYIGIVAPGWRQSKLIIRRIRFFLRKLPKDLCPKPARTVLYFSNESIIEAFPNNPDTIRGPTLQVIYWDEANFTPGDIDLWTAILFTISTTKGKVLVSSTPWNTDSVFYKIFHNPEFSDFSRSHVAWQQALEPNGPLDKKTLEAIRKQFENDPWRFRRECEAEWSEDESAWLPQSLITKCIATEKTLGEELELWDWEGVQKGSTLFAGVDLGRVQDHSVLVVIEQLKESKYVLRHLKIFDLGISYASVIGYVKTLQDRWGGFAKIRVDSTNQDYVVEDMTNSGIDNCEGVRFSLPRKQEMATLLKQRMANNQFWYPYFTWQKPYPGEWVSELNVERFELRKDGSIALNHPSGTHDDCFWACALALFATVEMQPEPFLAVISTR